MNHIDDMEQLRQGIGLTAYAQHDPKVEYRMYGFEMFEEMTEMIQEETLRVLYHVRIQQKVEREPAAKVMGTNKDDTLQKKPVQRKAKKIYAGNLFTDWFLLIFCGRARRGATLTAHNEGRGAS